MPDSEMWKSRREAIHHSELVTFFNFEQIHKLFIMQIKFCGAARTVTGSSHLITLDDGYKILLDCGLFQGKQAYIDEFNQQFLFDPKEINCLILSHAHIDHSGRIPKLVKEGFNGAIICTTATHDLSKIMLLDSAHIQEKDTEFHNKRRAKKGLPPLNPLYEAQDAEQALRKFIPINYEEWFPVREGVSALIRDNGHILGSGSVTLKIKRSNGREVSVAFTGDIGRPDRPILKDPAQMNDADYLISESTYGGRLHEKFPDDKDHLYKVVKETCIDRKGKIIIPSFSIGRTQEIVYMLDQLEHQGKLNHIPVFVDSPLSTNATEIYRRHPECFDDEIRNYMAKESNPFGFNNLQYITEVEQSKQLNSLQEPAIIISASGMAEAGRIIHHISNNVENPNNTILIVGYCAEGTLGWRLRTGIKEIKIFGEEKKVKAQIAVMDSFSAHGDQKEMLSFLDNLDRSRLKQTFLVHGEYDDGQLPFKTALEKNNFRNISIPQKGEVITID